MQIAERRTTSRRHRFFGRRAKDIRAQVITGDLAFRGVLNCTTSRRWDAPGRNPLMHALGLDADATSQRALTPGNIHGALYCLFHALNVTSKTCIRQEFLAMQSTSGACNFGGMTIGKRIKGTRESRRISQSELARQVGVSPQSVQQWESPNGTAPRGHRVSKIAKALDCDEVWLLTGKKSAQYQRSPLTKNQVEEEPNSGLGYGSKQPLNPKIIKEILDEIEKERLSHGDEEVPPDTVALIIAKAYPVFVQDAAYRAELSRIITDSLTADIPGGPQSTTKARESHEGGTS